MPIGNLTSQETANIYLDRLDQYCKHALRLHYYVRYMDDFIILVKGREEAQRILREIEGYLKRALHLDISPKSRILPATHDVEFVGYTVSPHGLRLRKKTTRHIKSSLKHVAELYALGLVDLDAALQTVNSYHGMTKHCNGYNLRRWIEDNITFQRREESVMNDTNPRDGPKRFYNLSENEDGTVDVYLAPDVTVYHTDEGTEYDIKLRVVRGIVPWPGLEDDIRARYQAWCESGEVIDL